jgi:hypothetical protein
MRMILCLALGVIFGCSMREALARDVGQWEAGDPAIRDWYKRLMQPDMPLSSCCGEADAYWADSYLVDGDRYVAILAISKAAITSSTTRRLAMASRVSVPHSKQWARLASS